MWLLFFLLFAAAPGDRIGEIEFFGTRGVDIAAVRLALGHYEGEPLASSEDERAKFKESVRSVVVAKTGHPPTDIAGVCCDDKGAWTIYIGLGEPSAEARLYRPRPRGAAKLPPGLVSANRAFLTALEPAVRTNASEHHSKGYAISTDPGLRKAQLTLRKRALISADAIYKVLETSADDEQRAMAAQSLGYLDPSSKQIAALVRASRDVDETVRNNAIRALWVIAGSGRAVPVGPFITMLQSGQWSDRNKSLLLLAALSDNLTPEALGDLKRTSLEELKEMALWRNPGHSGPAKQLLERLR